VPGSAGLVKRRTTREGDIGSLGAAIYPAGGATANPDTARSKSCACAPEWQAAAATAKNAPIGETMLRKIPRNSRRRSLTAAAPD
jgi:hypothetical protein